MYSNLLVQLFIFTLSFLICNGDDSSSNAAFGLGYGTPSYANQGYLRYFPMPIPILNLPPTTNYNGGNTNNYNSGNTNSVKSYVGKQLILNGDTNTSYGSNAVYESNLPNPYRIVKPGEAVSMLFMANRLTLYIDSNNIITSAGYN
ncbi:hypothetical protein K502DRAFT_328692 [Neoconidiobolus thromboides FSU 785]|nr:hypothetical protein K502DRAFT_328692 [Neoconidiobolus thromboides FSU 785]